MANLTKNSDIPLTIELIPKTTFFTNLRSLVAKESWDKIRRECYKNAGYLCEVCGGRGENHPVECHEIWSYDFNSGVQKLERLIALCPKCHSVKHWGLSQIRGIESECITHLCGVNKIDEETARNIVKKAFLDWEQKNKIKWKLDISIITK